ncbi:Histone-lysine N-methyltransferase set-2 [Cucumispora dikerogammari]|nr:Histone-lysine N-methyltransferase set-2 [Cucumispora dikerogammari]
MSELEFLIPYIGPICSVCHHPTHTICLGCYLFVHPECKACNCLSNDIIMKKMLAKHSCNNEKASSTIINKKDIAQKNTNKKHNPLKKTKLLEGTNSLSKTNSLLSNNKNTLTKNSTKKDEGEMMHRFLKKLNLHTETENRFQLDDNNLKDSLGNNNKSSENSEQEENSKEMTNRCNTCLVYYSSTDSDIQMLFCDGCHGWIHRQCVSVSEEEYLNMDINGDDFFCFKCLFSYCDLCGGGAGNESLNVTKNNNYNKNTESQSAGVNQKHLNDKNENFSDDVELSQSKAFADKSVSKALSSSITTDINSFSLLPPTSKSLLVPPSSSTVENIVSDPVFTSAAKPSTPTQALSFTQNTDSLLSTPTVDKISPEFTTNRKISSPGSNPSNMTNPSSITLLSDKKSTDGSISNSFLTSPFIITTLDNNLYFTDTNPTIVTHKHCLPPGYYINFDISRKTVMVNNTVKLFPYKEIIKTFQETEYKKILKLNTNKRYTGCIFNYRYKSKPPSTINKPNTVSNINHTDKKSSVIPIKNKNDNRKISIWKDTRIIHSFLKREQTLISNIVKHLKTLVSSGSETQNKTCDKRKQTINYLKTDSPLNSNWDILRARMLITDYYKVFTKLNIFCYDNMFFNRKPYEIDIAYDISGKTNNNKYIIYYRHTDYVFLPNSYENNIISLNKQNGELFPKTPLTNNNQNNAIINNPFSIMGSRIEVRYSPIDGFGGFAKHTLFKDELISIYNGIAISHDESNILESYYKSNKLGDHIYMFSFDSGHSIRDGTVIGNSAKFYNNSCEPNCYAKEILINEDTKELGVFAKRNIAKGEEVTYKYDLSGEDKVVCLCKSKGCVGHL